jgi:hypothetical protein
MNSVLSLDEEQAQAVRSSSPVSSERKAEPPFIAGSTNIVAAPSRGPASPSPSGGGSRLTDSERRARRAQRENKRRSKEAANTKRLLAARQASKQMAEDARKLKAQLRLARRRGMELSHTGGGGHHARFPRSRQVTIGQQVAVGGLNISGGSSNLFGTARTGAPRTIFSFRGVYVTEWFAVSMNRNSIARRQFDATCHPGWWRNFSTEHQKVE